MPLQNGGAQARARIIRRLLFIQRILSSAHVGLDGFGVLMGILSCGVMLD